MIKILYPVFGPLTQDFGVNPQDYAKFNLPGHNGLDWGVPLRTPVRAAYDGKLEKIGWDPNGYGNYIKLKHTVDGKTFYTLYAHFDEKPISKSEYKAGETIGRSGSTGNSSGPHLHFELIVPWLAQAKWKDRIDPKPYLVSDRVFYTGNTPVTETPTEPVSEETPVVVEPNKPAKVTSDIGLRIRSEPNLTAKIWFIAPFGTEFLINDIKDGWAEVILYASAEYLETIK